MNPYIDSRQDFWMNEVNAFMQLAEDNLERTIIWREKMTKTATDPLEYGHCIRQALNHALATIVFSALTVEAYINDYALRHFSKQFFATRLDTLSTLNKWVIIPRLVTGQSYPVDRQGYQELDKLIKMRHQIVHAKTKKLPPLEKEKELEDFGKTYIYEIISYAKTAIKVPYLAVTDLISIDPNEVVNQRRLFGDR
jgi:hypothetical protein